MADEWKTRPTTVPITPPATMRERLQPFVIDMRHLTTQLNIIASDMIRDKSLTKKLDEEPQYFVTTYGVTEEEIGAMRARDIPRLYQLGLHPFLLVRFAGMMGILEYWQKLDAPGRRDGEAAK
jgi:hypothetical protein